MLLRTFQSPVQARAAGRTQDRCCSATAFFTARPLTENAGECHGSDAKGTANGNNLTLGMWIWGDGSLIAIKATIAHNMKMSPGMDGQLTPADVDAVAAYVWAIGHQKN